MIIEVGKSYLNKRGEVKTITKRDGDNKYPYISADDLTFTPGGAYDRFGSDDDLVAEYRPDSAELCMTAAKLSARVTELEAESKRYLQWWEQKTQECTALHCEIERLKALIPQPKVVSVWQNIYDQGALDQKHDSREKADFKAGYGRLAVLRTDTITALDGTATYRTELEKT